MASKKVGSGRAPAASCQEMEKGPRTSADSQNLTQSELDLKPWKYTGYKGYTNFIASENDFFVLRRFSAVSVRVALRLQDQVTVLEEKLQRLDWESSRREAEDVHNGSLRDDSEERLQVLDELRQTLMRYNKFILQQAELKKHPAPLPYDIKSLENWHHNHLNAAISPPEAAYLSHPRDLFSVVPKEKSPLRRLLERIESFRVHWLFSDRNAPTLPSTDAQLITFISDKRIDAFINVVIISVGMAMLIAPIWILEFLSRQTTKLGTITGFIVAFLAMISYASSAKPFEVLAATAAYSAVLMVFLQLGTSSSPTPVTTA